MSDVRVLHVDDSEPLLDIAATFLERASDRIAVETETDPEAALDRLDGVDCVVSDYEMPGMDGLELLAAVRERHPDLPFVLFTRRSSEDIAEEALAAGATDYRQKETGTAHYRVLAHSIERAVRCRRASHRVAVLERRNDRLEPLLSSVAGELETAVSTAEGALGGADAPPEVERAHARLRELSAELRELEDSPLRRSPPRAPGTADD